VKAVALWVAAVLAVVAVGVGVEAGVGVGANPQLELQVFVNPAATNSQISAVGAFLVRDDDVSWCSYLDHQQSFALMQQVLARHPGISVPPITRAEVPTLYWCVLRSPTASAVASQLHALPNVYAVNYGAGVGFPTGPQWSAG
jgi:cell division protein FtsX